MKKGSAWDTRGRSCRRLSERSASFDCTTPTPQACENNRQMYDALGRRITTQAGGTVTDLYYSEGRQVLEEQVSGVTQRQYVWSPSYVDALVERDQGGQRLYRQKKVSLYL